jgi:gamma-glutamylputrescine oxidase
MPRDPLSRNDPIPGAYPPSWYAATAQAGDPRAPLKGSHRADVAIVGAGYTGLWAAKTLAERGLRPVILEAHRVGWGASGRNGGQIVNGLNASLDTIAQRYGPGVADSVATVVQEGGRIIRERVARYAIDCDLTDGNLFAAFTSRATPTSAACSTAPAGTSTP